MSFEVIATDDFLKSVKKILKKHRSIILDIEKLGDLLAVNPDHGISLGNNLYKIRLAISGSGKGKSGGARIITYVKVTKNTVYMSAVYLKSEISTIDEQGILQKLAADNLINPLLLKVQRRFYFCNRIGFHCTRLVFTFTVQDFLLLLLCQQNILIIQNIPYLLLFRFV